MRILSRQAWPLAVAAAAFALAVGLPAGDPDTWWHLASGRWMVEHRDVLRVDIFSSTATGEPYALGEWLGEVVLYLVFAAASWPGLLVLRAALVAVAAFFVTRLALRGAPPAVAVPVAAVALVLSKPVWTDRPQLFTLALFPVVLDLLLAARGGSRRALVAAVPLLFVWSDLHAGYALGVVLLWLFALDALLERRDAGAFLVAAVAATLAVSADPGALPLARSVAHVAGATRGIVEESPVDVLTPFGALFALVLGVTLLSFLRGGGSLLAAIVLVPMLWLALSAQRYIPLFGFAAVPFISLPSDLAAGFSASSSTDRTPNAPGLLSLGGRREASSEADRLSGAAASRQSRSDDPVHPVREPRREAKPDPSRTTPRSRLVLAALVMWVAALLSIATIPTRPDVSAYPAAALDELRSTSGVLLNEYTWGGYLIWNAPTRPVFVDGRLFPYATDGVLDQYRTAIAVLPGWRATIRRWNVAQALLRPDRPLVQALRDDGWTTVAQGSGYVLLERPR
ncbi:MAG: hypothetical protein KGK34_07490 [Chloroflexota bacterium]|nr:hypothetical protein [Chloroflexota bacterium]